MATAARAVDHETGWSRSSFSIIGIVRQFAGNGDDWTTGDIQLWVPASSRGTTFNPRTPAPGRPPRVRRRRRPITDRGPGRHHLATQDPRPWLESHRQHPSRTTNGELILAGSAGNGYRFAELMGASNPTGWSGVIKEKTPAGATAGYILLYSNP